MLLSQTRCYTCGCYCRCWQHIDTSTFFSECSFHPPKYIRQNHSPSSHNQFLFLYYNCRSLLPKLDNLSLCCATHSPDFVCLVETWLDSSISDNEISIPNYVCIRHDRNRHGGGVLFYIKNDYCYKTLSKGPSDTELFFITIHQGPTIGIFYRPPSSTVSVMNTLFDALSYLDISFFSNLVLIGDFNIDVLSHSHYLCNHLYRILDCFSLSQVNTAPTHCSQNGHQALIDLALLSSPEHLIISCKTVPLLGNSDHLGLHIMINGGVRKHRSTNPSRRQVWHYAHANFDLASIMLSNCDLNTIEWHQSKLGSLEKVFLGRYGKMHTNCPPTKSTKPTMVIKVPNTRKRNRLFQKARASNDSEVWNRYRILCNKLVTKLREAKFTYFSQLNPQNCKEFWKAVKYTNKK